MNYRLVFQLVCFAALVIWAWRKGGGPERASTGTMLAMMLIDRLYHLLIDPTIQLDTVDTWHFTLDLMVLTALVPIALWANRFYPMFLAALQLISLNGHFAREAFDQVTPLAYIIMVVGPSYAQLVTLTVGLWLHVRRVERFGPYRNWRRSAHPA